MTGQDVGDKLAITELLYTATSRSTFCVVQQTDTVALQPIVVGRYADTFARDADGWYFTDRQADVQMVGDVSDHLHITL